MDVYTLDRNFHQKDIIDEFKSIIWTERYYGNSEVELYVPATTEMIKKIPPGTFLSIFDSDEVMILESALVTDDNTLKLVGQSLLTWMDNRFIRNTAAHNIQSWVFPAGKPGWAIHQIIWNGCHKDSPFLKGTYPMGVTNPQQLIIPGLTLKGYDQSGKDTVFTVDFEPVYTAMTKIAIPYEIGMQLTLDSVTDTSYSLGFRNYKGLDRTSGQTGNPIVRFSPQMDSFSNISEIRSIGLLKTLVCAYATSPDPTKVSSAQGQAALTDAPYTGFDLRALQLLDSSITDEMVGTDNAKLYDLLSTLASKELKNHPYIKSVDGEIVPTSQFKYGVHYNLGDLIEVQGHTEIVSKARVTEYIRSQDDAGERAYPTVVMIE